MEPVEAFNALPPERAEAELLACCAAPRWARQVAAGRPYPDLPSLLTVAGAASAGLAWADITQALAAHPRIGERPTGGGREAAWSRREQSGVDGADPDAREALARVNKEYEDRFGHLFLVCASGRGDAELLAAARVRLAHDESTERGVVRTELGKIARRRLERLLAYAAISTHVLDTVRGEPARGVAVRLDRRSPGGWEPAGEGRTDGDGRLRDWVPALAWGAGDYRLVFDVAAHSAFFPEVAVAFRIADPQRHHHLPLLLSPYGYTTYRGS
jgi:hydroxyisourate hydrolase